MEMTDDELTVVIEALREYRLRLAVDSPRRIVTEALIHRAAHKLLPNA